MRRFRSVETSTTRVCGCSFCRARVWPRIRLSAPWPGRLSGRPLPRSRVWKKRRPAGGGLPWLVVRVRGKKGAGGRLLAMVVGAGRGNRQARVDLLLGDAADHVVEKAAGLAGI